MNFDLALSRLMFCIGIDDCDEVNMPDGLVADTNFKFMEKIILCETSCEFAAREVYVYENYFPQYDHYYQMR